MSCMSYVGWMYNHRKMEFVPIKPLCMQRLEREHIMCQLRKHMQSKVNTDFIREIDCKPP